MRNLKPVVGALRPKSMTQDEIAIRALVDQWMRASMEGDLDTVLGLMTDDVVFMVPGREPFGKTEFAQNSRAMSGARIEGKSEIVELKVAGSVAYLRNRLEVSVTPPNGE